MLDEANSNNNSPTADELSKYARWLQSQRAQVEGECAVCGTHFVGTRKKKYCSHRCAQRAHVQNKKGTAK